MATRASNRGRARGGSLPTRGRGNPPPNRGRGGPPPNGRGDGVGLVGGGSQRRPPKQPHDGLDPAPLRTLVKPNGISGQDATVSIADLTYIGSYNWVQVEDGQRTIVVPGAPPEWLNKPFPYTVNPDVGLNYINQNGFRIPSAPLLPLFRAVDVVAETKKETIDWTSVDFVTDRNNLRKLFRWVRASDEGPVGRAKDFRIDLQLAGKKTVLMNRWDSRVTAWSDGDAHPSYGYNFEKESTRPVPGCENTIGHNRIIKYKLGNFTMVVRFDVDAYLPGEGATEPIPDSGNIDTLAGLLSGMSVSPESSNSDTDIRVNRAGVYVKQNSIMELMTRNQKNASFQWVESYPQLFLSQTPHFYIAVQSGGTFTKAKTKDLGDPEVVNVANSLHADLRKLLGALELVKELVIAGGKEGRYSLVNQSGELKLYRRVSQDSCLPEEVLRRFDT